MFTPDGSRIKHIEHRNPGFLGVTFVSGILLLSYPTNKQIKNINFSQVFF